MITTILPSFEGRLMVWVNFFQRTDEVSLQDQGHAHSLKTARDKIVIKLKHQNMLVLKDFVENKCTL